MSTASLEALHVPLARELPGIIERVALRFPATPISAVEHVVRAEAQRLHRQPVHDFLAILVERAACDVLRSMPT